MNSHTYFPLVSVGISMGFLTLLSIFLSCVYFKQHVYIKKKIKIFFLKELQAHTIKHIHFKKPDYLQNNFILGFGFIFQKSEYGGPGLFEKQIPDTIISDFEFSKEQTPENLLALIKEIFEKTKFEIIQNTKDTNSLILSKKTTQVRVKIIPLKELATNSHRRYRLICTWITI